MSFVPNPVPPSIIRVVRPATIRATRRSRPWLKLFMFGALALVIGVLLLVWPMARITVTPKLESMHVSGEIHIDLDARDTVASAGIVPGQVLGKGDTITTMLKSPRTVRLAGSIVTYSATHVDAVVVNTVAQAVGQDYSVVTPTAEPTWGEPVPGASGRQVSIPFSSEVKRYRKFPVQSWKSHLAGQSIAEAESWLSEQPGVEATSVSLFPAFFANFSQKIPRSASSSTFTLDIAGKTSILE